MTPREYSVLYLFAGCGGVAKGFVDATPNYDGVSARFRTVAGIDSDGDALQAFEALAEGPGLQWDLLDEEGYRAVHGCPPPPGWEAIEAADLRARIPEAPDVVFTSPPCKGLSRLITQKKSEEPKYAALNRLTLRGVMLALEAWDRPPKFLVLENVPDLATRGKDLLRQIVAALESRGYSVASVPHDLGEWGHLAQRRKRMALVARHVEQVPPFLFEPPSRGHRSIGDVLFKLPMPGDPAGGPMHELGRYRWLTWLRLALVPAGKDWRALRDLRVVDGQLADYALMPESTAWRGGPLGVLSGDAAFSTVTSSAGPTNGTFSIADPRAAQSAEYGQYGVIPAGEPMGAVSGQCLPTGGRYAIEDPRPGYGPGRHHAVFRVTEGAAGTVTSKDLPADGGISISDPRLGGTRHNNVYRVVSLGEHSAAITAGTSPSSGGLAVQDPRTPPMTAQPTGIPAPTDRGRWAILSVDGTWHRPITKLEAGVLQGFDPLDMGCAVDVDGNPADSRMVFPGQSARKWQLMIGNAVPPPAARAIAEVIGQALIQADLGMSFALDLLPVWARSHASAISMEAGK